MICQRVKATARVMGVGLIAVTMTASAALAQAQKTTCPFTSKDIDGWYKDIGFDTAADDAGGANVTCTVDSYGTYATLSEIELAPFDRPDPLNPNQSVVDLRTGKSILVDLQSTGGYQGAAKYTIELVRDGVPLVDSTHGGLTTAGYEACVAALTSSQAWKRWACGK